MTDLIDINWKIAKTAFALGSIAFMVLAVFSPTKNNKNAPSSLLVASAWVVIFSIPVFVFALVLGILCWIWG